MFFNGQGLAETFLRPFRDSFLIKCIFSSYLNLKTTPNFFHVQSQVCRFYFYASSKFIYVYYTMYMYMYMYFAIKIISYMCRLL